MINKEKQSAEYIETKLKINRTIANIIIDPADQDMLNAIKYLCGYRYELHFILNKPIVDFYMGQEAEDKYFVLFCAELKKLFPLWSDSKIEENFECCSFKELQLTENDLQHIAEIIAEHIFVERKILDNELQGV